MGKVGYFIDCPRVRVKGSVELSSMAIGNYRQIFGSPNSQFRGVLADKLSQIFRTAMGTNNLEELMM